MTYGSNNSPKAVSFTQVTDNHAVVAQANISKALLAEGEARVALENANFRLAKATEILRDAEITFRGSVSKSAWNKDEIRKAYNNALAGFRDADLKAIEATEAFTKAKNAVSSLNSIAKGEVVKREFTPAKREALAEKGHAMPDGSFPIESKGDLKNAIASAGRAKDYDATKKHIIEQAKRLDAMDALPESWKSPTATMKSVADFFKGSDSKPKCAMCKGEGTIRGGNVTCPECKGKKVVAKDADETLATVMRHDQDHDDWHRSHGDAPCTSEADCATKRAKYDEVKAEQSAQMTKADKVNYERLIGNQKGEPADADLYEEVKADAKEKFDVYPSAVANGWIVQEYKRRDGKYRKPVSKGDVEGHEFHGNQYTASSGASTLSDRSRKHFDDKVEPLDSSSSSIAMRRASEGHRAIADAHHRQAIAAQNPAESHLNTEILHAQAMDEHNTAADAWEGAANLKSQIESGRLQATSGNARAAESLRQRNEGELQSEIANAHRASATATDASEAVVSEASYEDKNTLGKSITKADKVSAVCPVCKGGKLKDKCGVCKGTGKVFYTPAKEVSVEKAEIVMIACPACQAGDAMKGCEYCDGEGEVPKDGMEEDFKSMEEDDNSGFTTKSLLARDFEKSEGYKAYIAKGDVAGHEFHGNQYQAGTGGGSAPLRLASNVVARGTRGERGNLRALKEALKVGTKVTLIGANPRHRSLGVERTISKVQANRFVMKDETGHEVWGDFPKASDLTFDKGTGTFTFHGHDLMAQDETGKPMDGNLTYQIKA